MTRLVTQEEMEALAQASAPPGLKEWYEDWDPPFDEEKEWEKHLDYLHFLRHGGDPWWAQ